MAASTIQVGIEVSARGTRQAATDLAAVDAALQGLGAHAASLGNVSPRPDMSGMIRSAQSAETALARVVTVLTAVNTSLQSDFAPRTAHSWETMARAAGVTTTTIDRLSAAVTANQAALSRDAAFRTLQQAAGLTSAQLARLRIEMNDTGGAFKTAMGALNVTPVVELKSRIKEAAEAYKIISQSSTASGRDVKAAHEAMVAAARSAAAQIKGAGATQSMSPLAESLRAVQRQAHLTSAEMDRLNAAARRTGSQRELTEAFSRIQQATGMSATQMAALRLRLGDVSGAFGTLGAAANAARLALAATAAAVLYAGKSCFDAALEMDRLNKAYTAIYGSSAAATEQLGFVYDTSVRLGLQFQKTAESAKTFFAAGRDSALAGQINDIFSAVSSAGAALSLSTEQVQGTFLALGQMISKGKVQAEELRGQLGERLPGAFQLAAKAMGMTTAELDKFMADGKLTAEDLLPRLADVLQNKFGPAAASAAQGAQGAVNRLSTEWNLFKATVLDNESIIAAINAVTNALQSRNAAYMADAARQQTIKEMEEFGIEKHTVTREVFDAWGGTQVVELRAYTEEQIKNFQGLNKAWADFEKSVDEHAKVVEKRLGDSARTVNDYLKNTLASQEARENAAYESALAAVDTRIEEYKKSNQDISGLLDQRSRIHAEHQRKMASLHQKGQKSATSAARAQDTYTSAVEKTEASIRALHAQIALDPSEKVAARRIQIQKEYEQSIAGIAREMNDLARRGVSSGEIAALKNLREQEASLKKQYELQQAEREERDKNVQLTGEQLNFYKELEQLGGRYGATIELQNQLLDGQMEKLCALQLPESYIAQWRRLKELELSEDFLDGATRGLLRFMAEARDQADAAEKLVADFAQGFDDTARDMFERFVETGELSLKSFAELFKKALIDLAYQAALRPIVVQMVGGLGGLMGLGGGTAFAGTTAGQGGYPEAARNLAGMVPGVNISGLPVGQLLPQSATAGLFSGITDTVNSAMAGWLPNMFVAQQMELAGPTLTGAPLMSGTTFTGMLGAGAGGLGLGLAAGQLLGNVLFPSNSNVSSGISYGMGAGAGLGAAIGSAVPGIGTVVGGLIGGLLGGGAGGGIGSLFGGDQDIPNPGGRLRMRGELGKGADWMMQKGDGNTTGGSKVFTRDGFKMSGFRQALEAPVREIYAQYDAFVEQVPERFRQDFKTLADKTYISLNTGDKKGEDWDAELLERKILKPFRNQIAEGIINSFATLDMSSLAIADFDAYTAEIRNINAALTQDLAAGVDEAARHALEASAAGQREQAFKNNLVTTQEEIFAALTAGFSYYNLSSLIPNAEEYGPRFREVIGQKLLDVFAAVDMSGIRVDFDRGSVAGLQTLMAALQGWQEVTGALEAVLNPVSELETQLAAAATQFDGWLDNLRALGWQEEAVAEVEAKRAVYLEKYAGAVTRSLEQDLRVRTLTIAASDEENAVAQAQLKITQLRIRQENELAEAVKNVGRESALYAQTVRVQEAEMAALVRDMVRTGYDALIARRDDLLARRDKLMGVEEETVETAKRRLDDLNSRLEQLRQQQIDAAEQLRDVFEGMVDTLREARSALWGGSANPDTRSRQQSVRAEFDRLYADAMSGDTEAAGTLAASGNALLALVKATAVNSEEYNNQFYEVDKRLREAQEYAAQQSALQQAQIDALKGQEETTKSIEDQIAELMPQISAAEAAYEALLAEQTALIDRQLSELQPKIDSAEAELRKANANLEALRTIIGGLGANGGGGLQSLQALLEAKAAAMNAGLTLNEGHIAQGWGNGGWTAESVKEEMIRVYGSVETWLQQAGKNEGFTISGAYTGAGNVNGNAPTSSPSVAAGSSSGPYGGRTEAQVLRDKAASLNATRFEGRTDWTSQAVLRSIRDNHMTFPQWYERFGRAEGFARGGVASAGVALVGEEGPELIHLGSASRIYPAEQTAALLGGTQDSGITAGLVVRMSDSVKGILDILGKFRRESDEWTGEILRQFRSAHADFETLTNVEKSIHHVLDAQTVAVQIGFSDVLAAVGTVNTSVGATNSALTGMTQGLASLMAAISASRPSGGSASSLQRPSGGGSSGSSSGPYGGRTQEEVLRDKVASLNATAYDGRRDWTREKALQAMRREGMTFPQWYERFGRAEGFAAGGVPPVGVPVMVGEEGPEMAVFSAPARIYSVEDTQRMLSVPSPAAGADTRALREMTREIRALRQENADLRREFRALLTSINRSTTEMANIARNNDAEGMPVRGVVHVAGQVRIAP